MIWYGSIIIYPYLCIRKLQARFSGNQMVWKWYYTWRPNASSKTWLCLPRFCGAGDADQVQLLLLRSVHWISGSEWFAGWPPLWYGGERTRQVAKMLDTQECWQCWPPPTSKSGFKTWRFDRSSSMLISQRDTKGTWFQTQLLAGRISRISIHRSWGWTAQKESQRS